MCALRTRGGGLTGEALHTAMSDDDCYSGPSSRQTNCSCNTTSLPAANASPFHMSECYQLCQFGKLTLVMLFLLHAGASCSGLSAHGACWRTQRSSVRQMQRRSQARCCSAVHWRHGLRLPWMPAVAAPWPWRQPCCALQRGSSDACCAAAWLRWQTTATSSSWPRCRPWRSGGGQKPQARWALQQGFITLAMTCAVIGHES